VGTTTRGRRPERFSKHNHSKLDLDVNEAIELRSQRWVNLRIAKRL
jgi:hypothetical protein